MIEGTFDIAVETPKYHRRGVMTLKSNGDGIVMRLDVGDLDTLEFTGTCHDKDFEFEGSGELPGMGETAYTATGNVWGNSVTLNAQTSAGKVEIFGTRLSASAGGEKSSHDWMMKASTGDFSAGDNTMYSGLYSDGA